MATTGTLMAWLASFIALCAQLQPVLATFWTVTIYEVEVVSSYKARPACTVTDCYYDTITTTITLPPHITPTASPTSSTTTTDGEAEVVTLYLPGSAVPSSLLTETSQTVPLLTIYEVHVTLTPPAQCETQFIYTTAVRVDIPPDVEPYITGYSTVTKDGPFVYLDPTAVPTHMLELDIPFGSDAFWVSHCKDPHAKSTTSAEEANAYWCRETGSGCFPYWIIAVAIIPPLIFLIGFLESYLWFRRLMLGRGALRFGTICWCLLCFWVILLTRRSASRSEADQKLLREYWATLSAGTRLRLWCKWGFRWKYPAELLGEPPRDSAVPATGPVTQQRQPLGPPGQHSVGVGEKQQATANMTGVESYPNQQGQSYAIVMQPGQGGYDPAAPLPAGYVYMPVYMGQQQPGTGLGSMPDGADGQQQGYQGLPGEQPPH